MNSDKSRDEELKRILPDVAVGIMEIIEDNQLSTSEFRRIYECGFSLTEDCEAAMKAQETVKQLEGEK